jgi:hypothetical protein
VGGTAVADGLRSTSPLKRGGDPVATVRGMRGAEVLSSAGRPRAEEVLFLETRRAARSMDSPRPLRHIALGTPTGDFPPRAVDLALIPRPSVWRKGSAQSKAIASILSRGPDPHSLSSFLTRMSL